MLRFTKFSIPKRPLTTTINLNVNYHPGRGETRGFMHPRNKTSSLPSRHRRWKKKNKPHGRPESAILNSTRDASNLRNIHKSYNEPNFSNIGRLTQTVLDETSTVTKANSYTEDLFNYYEQHFNYQPEDILEILKNPDKLLDKDSDLRNVNDSGQVGDNFTPEYDPDRPMPSGFGNLSSSSMVSAFTYQQDENEIEEYLTSHKGILGRSISEDNMNQSSKSKIILNFCSRVYENYHKLLNTDPYWGMSQKKETIWNINDLVTRKHFDESILDYIDKFRRVEVGIVDHVEPPQILAAGAVKLHEDTVYEQTFVQVKIEFKVIKNLSIYNRFGKLIFADDTMPQACYDTVVFEIPKNVYNSPNSRWRIHQLESQHASEPAVIHTDFKIKDTKSETVDSFIADWSEKAKLYENMQTFVQEKSILKPNRQDTDNPVFNTVNINFPEIEDIQYVQKKWAQARDEFYDHRGSPLTQSVPGYQGNAHIKYLARMWFLRSRGWKTHMTYRGFGLKLIYDAKMMPGSVGENYGLYYKQLIGRKRIQIFAKRVSGILPLPAAENNATIVDPPSQPIGWDEEHLGKWKKNEPYAMFSGKHDKIYPEHMGKNEMYNKVWGTRIVDHNLKNAPMSEFVKDKREPIPQHIRDKIVLTNKQKRMKLLFLRKKLADEEKLRTMKNKPGTMERQ